MRTMKHHGVWLALLAACGPGLTPMNAEEAKDPGAQTVGAMAPVKHAWPGGQPRQSSLSLAVVLPW